MSSTQLRSTALVGSAMNDLAMVVGQAAAPSDSWPMPGNSTKVAAVAEPGGSLGSVRRIEAWVVGTGEDQGRDTRRVDLAEWSVLDVEQLADLRVPGVVQERRAVDGLVEAELLDVDGFGCGAAIGTSDDGPSAIGLRDKDREPLAREHVDRGGVPSSHTRDESWDDRKNAVTYWALWKDHTASSPVMTRVRTMPSASVTVTVAGAWFS